MNFIYFVITIPDKVKLIRSNAVASIRNRNADAFAFLVDRLRYVDLLVSSRIGKGIIYEVIKNLHK